MPTETVILVAAILVFFSVFAVTLAWVSHVSVRMQRERDAAEARGKAVAARAEPEIRRAA